MARPKGKTKQAQQTYKPIKKIPDADRLEQTNTGLSPVFSDLLLARPLPQTQIFGKLDHYYTGLFETVCDSIEFLADFTSDLDPKTCTFFNLDGLRAFFECYEDLAHEIRLTPKGLSLDLLVSRAEEKLGLPKRWLIGEVRRALNWAIDRKGDELGMLCLATHKKAVIEKSIQVALDESHPDSFLERKSLMQFFQIAPVPKGAQVQVNLQQNTLNQVKGLPSFESSVTNIGVSLKQLGEGAKREDSRRLGSKQEDYIDVREIEDETEEEVILVEG